MKILHVITSLRLGGAEKLLSDLLPRIKAQRHEVAVYTFLSLRTPITELLEESGITVYSGTEKDGVYSPSHIIRLRKIARDYDIIHTHNTSPQLYAAIANIGLGKTLVTTEHSTNNRRRSNVLWRPIDRWMYRQYQRVICISDPCEQNLREYLQSDSQTICTILNGIDTIRFAEAEPAEEYSHEKLGAQHILINVAGFRWEKDQPTIIRAMQHLPENFHLLLVGWGEQQRIADCKQLTESLGVSERVHFLGMRTDVPNLLKATDIVIMSSHFEGLSLSNLEGMAAGKPFIASDVDGLREVVSGYGLLFPHEDSEALAKTILELGENPQYADEIAARCQLRAQQYDISKMVEGYNNVYLSLSSGQHH